MKRILAVGVEIPDPNFEYVPFTSDRSLLDGDIILFDPRLPPSHSHERYGGESLYSETESLKVSRAVSHWKSELQGAADAGKTIVIFLSSPRTHYYYTGERQLSGTGRGQSTTRIVSQVSAYDSLPFGIGAEAKTGSVVKLTKDGAFLSSYWSLCSAFSFYEAIPTGKFDKGLITTVSGNRTIAALLQRVGSILLLPPLHLETAAFQRHDRVKQTLVWTQEASRFGKRLVAEILHLAEALALDKGQSPPPMWCGEDEFRTREEARVLASMDLLHKEVESIQEQERQLQLRLTEAGRFRALLHAQGAELERAVRETLTLFGFEAVGYRDATSEFDVVFQSREGRFLGEVEGKDNRPINIEKFSQLERNIHEDFDREEVTSIAKGVLFGNAERLAHPSKRGQAFTDKCLTAAKRAGVALVRTMDLYVPATYLAENPTPEYAASCREAIFRTSGELVAFPAPPPCGAEATSPEQGKGKPARVRRGKK